MLRYAAKVDGPHAAIRDGLRKLGWLVLDSARMASGGPDLIAVTPEGVVRLFEVKAPQGRLRPRQQALQAQGWPIRVVTTLDEALDWRY